jgi:hypothetical protein
MQSERWKELVTNSFGMKPARAWGAHILLGSNQRRACLRERSGRRWGLFSI